MTAHQRLAATPWTFRFPAVVTSWHDGDTVTVVRGAWPGVTLEGERVRVEGMNAPELAAAGGAAARDYAASLAPPGSMVVLTATHQEKYGRLLARVTLPDGRDLSQVMIDTGHAVYYNPT
jgi:micrococcal nuclease